MKKLGILLTLFVTTALISTAVVAGFHTDHISTVKIVGTALTSFYLLTALRIIPMPQNVLGMYIGAPGFDGTGQNEVGVQVVNQERARGAYMTYRKNARYAGKKITAGYVRLEALITNGNNKIPFTTFVGDGTSQTPSERRLERNDKFGVTDIGFYLLKQPVGKSTGELQAYANDFDFGAAAPDLESLYNGKLSIVVGDTRIISALDMMTFKKVPETQKSGVGTRNQFSLKETMYPLTPHVDIDGSGTNEIEITYPAHSAWAGGTAATGFAHYAVLYFKGFLITGGSSNI